MKVSNSTMLMVLAPALVALCVAGVYVGTQQEPLAGPEPPATTYYVSTTGDNGHDGKSEATAWRTITYAADTVVAGDTVMIKAGTYVNEHVTPDNSGTSTSPIVFEGYGGTVTLDGVDRTGYGIYIGGRSYVTIKNLFLCNYSCGFRMLSSNHITVDNTTLEDMGISPSGTGFSISGSTSYSTISNCTMKNCAMHCLNLMSYASYNLVDNCTFYITSGEPLCADYGIYTENAHHNTIQNSRIINLNPRTPGHHGHGIALRGTSYNNTVINCESDGLLEAFVVGEYGYNNEFINCTARDTQDSWQVSPNGHSDGLVARMGAHDNKFINCRSLGCSQGICLWTDSSHVQRRNLFQNCIVHNAKQFGVILNKSEDNRIENCVIADCKYLFYLPGAVNNVIKNSIITDVDYLVYGSGTQPVTTYTCFWANGFSALSGTGNFTADPLFAGGDDYHIKSTGGRWDPVTELWVIDAVASPCIDTGDPIDDYSTEPAPNGGRINVGAYGNTAEASKSGGPPADVVGRYVFYNNSFFDGDDPAANAADDAAIATNKTALLPGGMATFANYTSYDKGINGVMVDISGLAGTPTAEDDFVFRIGDDNDPSGWTVLPPSLASITVRTGAGVGGSDRVTIIWADILKKQWVQVTVKATAVTGLSAPDVFYFGNAVGDSGNSVDDAAVNTTDETRARQDPHKTLVNPADVENHHDYNRDGVANTTDEIVSRLNNTTLLTALKLITVP